MSEGKGNSPYARKQKAPYRYSSEYEAWRSNPSYSNDVAHGRMLVRTFGQAYWRNQYGQTLLNKDCYK